MGDIADRLGENLAHRSAEWLKAYAATLAGAPWQDVGKTESLV